MTNELIAEFFSNEFDDHARAVLIREIDAGRVTEVTFNVFNVRIDPEGGIITLQDDLDPTREAEVGLAEFLRMMAQH